MNNEIKLTRFSHGSGCGCKISPQILNEILKNSQKKMYHPALLVGNDNRDDAAVYAIDDQNAIISTTDFFMPIVDDPFDFGAIASVNAISDVYAMGGNPLLAIAILGWPIDKLPAKLANNVLEGARKACLQAGIPLAGGHSIDTPEPIFGLAVTGTVKINQLKQNNSATAGCGLYLTKPLGVGILTTAQKQGILEKEDFLTVRNLMLKLNDIGSELAKLDCVKAMTDVTGFGLAGHLLEMCEGSNLTAKINYYKVPKLDCLPFYISKKTFPGGMNRNYKSYGSKISPLSDDQKAVLCDPQTSGGLLIAIEENGISDAKAAFEKHNLTVEKFGLLVSRRKHFIEVE